MGGEESEIKAGLNLCTVLKFFFVFNKILEFFIIFHLFDYILHIFY